MRRAFSTRILQIALCPLLPLVREVVEVDALESDRAFGGDAEVVFDHELDQPLPVDER